MHRSPLKYHGGKSALADWFVDLAPPAHTYTHRNSVFAGGLDEFLGTRRWPMEGISETVNDLNNEVCNFWYVLRTPSLFAEFQRICNCLPFADSVLDWAGHHAQPAEILGKAVAFFVKQRMSQQGSQGHINFATPTRRTRRGMNENVSAWLSAVEGLPDVHERLSRVEVRNLDALKFLRMYDHEKAFFYLDPPYVAGTRVGGEYAHEMDDDRHEAMLQVLVDLKGRFMLSGYASDLYNHYARGANWRVERNLVTKASSRGDVKPLAFEYAWMNY